VTDATDVTETHTKTILATVIVTASNFNRKIGSTRNPRTLKKLPKTLKNPSKKHARNAEKMSILNI
jgi:hypothetical protein